MIRFISLLRISKTCCSFSVIYTLDVALGNILFFQTSPWELDACVNKNEADSTWAAFTDVKLTLMCSWWGHHLYVSLSGAVDHWGTPVLGRRGTVPPRGMSCLVDPCARQQFKVWPALVECWSPSCDAGLAHEHCHRTTVLSDVCWWLKLKRHHSEREHGFMGPGFHDFQNPFRPL